MTLAIVLDQSSKDLDSCTTVVLISSSLHPLSTAVEDVVIGITPQTLPVELLAEILSELDLDSLIVVSCLSRRLRAITAVASLNLWRRPILRNFQRYVYEESLFHLSLHSTLPRQNWIEILTFASTMFLLFDTTLPNWAPCEWEECFCRRFLPGWTKWNIVVNRNGTLNELEAAPRSFNPLAIFHEMRSVQIRTGPDLY